MALHAEALTQREPVGFQRRAARLAAGGDDRASSQQPGFDGRFDALAALRVRQAGGVPDQHHPVVGNRARRGSVEKIRVPAPGGGEIRGQVAGRHQGAHEVLQVAGESVAVLAAEPDVQHRALPEAPAIALQIGAEVQLRLIRAHSTGRLLLGCERELHLACRDDRLGPLRTVEPARDRAEVTARAHDEPRRDVAVHAPAVRRPRDGRHGRAVQDARPRPAEQVVVELSPQDTEAHRPVVARVDQRLSHDARAETRDGLEHAIPTVLLDVERERLDHSRRDPAGTDLVPGERRLVENQHVDAAAPKLPRARRPGRTAADHEHLARRRHGWLRGAARRRAGPE